MMVHWHEGLFLLPQHLQALQKFVLDEAGAERRFIHRFGGGVLELDLTLSRESVEVRRLRAIMPDSGTLLDYPHNVVIPDLNISAALANARSRGKGFELSLAVPKWSQDDANSFEIGEEPNRRTRRRYCLVEENLADENSGGEKKAVFARKFYARLLLEGEDQTGLEVLPLARIEPSPGDQLPRPEEKFVPPLLRLKGSRVLFDLVEKLVNAIEGARASILKRIQDGTFNLESLHGNQLGLLLRLRTVNHFLPRLKALLQADQAAPFEVFCELASMAGELVALDPVNDSLLSEGFAHKAPYDQFARLDQNIRRYLDSTQAASYRQIIFSSPGERRWGAGPVEKLERALLEAAADVYLCVESEEHQDVVSDLVASPDRLRFQPGSRDGKPQRGIPLKQVNTPKNLPAQRNHHYFRVVKDFSPDVANLWKLILEEQKVAVYWGPRETTRISGLSLFLIMSG